MSADTAPSELPPHTDAELPETHFSHAIDRLTRRICGALSWLWLALVAIILANVILRYSFGEGRIELEELQWHLFAVGFLFALSLGVVTDDHIRVDLIHERMSVRRRAWIELYGTVLLLLPFLAVVLWFALPFAELSFRTGEVSQAPGGLPHRWLIKSALPASFMLLLLTALARASRATCLLFRWPRARHPSAASVSQGAPHGGE